MRTRLTTGTVWVCGEKQSVSSPPKTHIITFHQPLRLDTERFLVNTSFYAVLTGRYCGFHMLTKCLYVPFYKKALHFNSIEFLRLIHFIIFPTFLTTIKPAFPSVIKGVSGASTCNYDLQIYRNLCLKMTNRK